MALAEARSNKQEQSDAHITIETIDMDETAVDAMSVSNVDVTRWLNFPRQPSNTVNRKLIQPSCRYLQVHKFVS